MVVTLVTIQPIQGKLHQYFSSIYFPQSIKVIKELDLCIQLQSVQVHFISDLALPIFPLLFDFKAIHILIIDHSQLSMLMFLISDFQYFLKYQLKLKIFFLVFMEIGQAGSKDLVLLKPRFLSNYLISLEFKGLGGHFVSMIIKSIRLFLQKI